MDRNTQSDIRRHAKLSLPGMEEAKSQPFTECEALMNMGMESCLEMLAKKTQIALAAAGKEPYLDQYEALDFLMSLQEETEF